MATVRPSIFGSARRLSLADGVLAALVIAVVGLMIVPLPTGLLDVLLSANIAISCSILLVTIYVDSALRIAAFPTLLLITTLVRLALNISTTRLILLQADAGRVIEAFGQFVVSGNYVVGAIIFLILAIVQYVVIARGSERVAEVGARFSLDALPGKQMAIDAELKSGTLDAETARQRRHELERSNQFYGSMDGAMKFVKGDVVASFIITAINILGGLVIGMGQRDLSLEAALRRYGLLTIGDGLVTQIPALLVATAAGILVTRVASERGDVALGEDLSTQLLRVPRALGVAGFFVAVLALVPGLPTVPFLVIGGLLLLASGARARLAGAASPESGPPSLSRAPDEARFVPMVVPWSVEVSSDLQGVLEGKGRHDRPQGLAPQMEDLRHSVFRELGLPLPRCTLTTDPSLASGHAIIRVHEVPARVLSFEPNEAVSETIRSAAHEVCRAHAADFLGMTETQELLDELAKMAPGTVRQTVPKPLDVAQLTEVLRRLLDEGISIRDLKTILEALAPVAATERDPLALAEQARRALRRPITYELTAGEPTLAVYMLDPTVEQTIREAITTTSAGRFVTLAPAARRDIVRAVERAVESAPPPDDRPAVVLAATDTRRFVRKLIETDLPDVRVVSHAELVPELTLTTRATATLAGI